MRFWTFLLLASGVSATLAAEPQAVTVQTQHFQITSYAGKSEAEQEGNFLESLVTQFTQVLQIGPSSGQTATPLLSVELFPTLKAYEATVLPLLGKAPTPPLALKFSAEKSQLLGVVHQGDNSSWAFQTFLEWFWATAPQAPAWLEEGLARYFWDISGEAPAWQFGQNLVFADDLLKQWTQPPELSFLTKTKLTDQEALSAWGLVTFFMNTSNPSYSRAFGAYLANLASQSNKLTHLKPDFAPALSKDCWNWWQAHPGRATLLQEAEKALKNGDGKTAQPLIAQALQLKTDGNTLYLAGLAAYESKEYAQAEADYLKAQEAWKKSPPGLLDYALGLTFYQEQKWTEAKAHFTSAGKASETYKKLAEPLLANLP